MIIVVGRAKDEREGALVGWRRLLFRCWWRAWSFVHDGAEPVVRFVGWLKLGAVVFQSVQWVDNRGWRDLHAGSSRKVIVHDPRQNGSVRGGGLGLEDWRVRQLKEGRRSSAAMLRCFGALYSSFCVFLRCALDAGV